MILAEIQATFCSEIKKNCEIKEFNTTFEVKDGQNQTPVYIANAEDYDFQVINPENKTVYFLPIDECVFVGNKEKKCDFSLCENGYFVLVDIKDVKRNQRNEAKKEAVKQLKATLIKIQTKVDTSEYQIFVVIGLTFLNDFPARKTSLQNAQFLFDEWNAILLEGNAFSFETAEIQKLI